MSSLLVQHWSIRLTTLVCFLMISACGDLLNSNDATTAQPAAVTVDRIEINPANPTAAAGTQVALTVTAIMSDSTKADMSNQATWNSSDAAMATVQADAMGKPQAKALKMGNVTLTATYAGKQASAAFAVTSATLVSLEVTPALSSIAHGTTQQFKATGVFTDSSTQDLTAAATWNSDAAATAGLSNIAGSNGLASTLQPGTTQVSAVSGSVKSPAVTMTVTSAALVSIAITPTAPSIAKGTTQQLTAQGTYTDNSTQDLTNTVTWNSSSITAATVSNTIGSNGLVNSVAVGSTNVTAVSGSVTSQTVALAVTPAKLVSINITPTSALALIGTTQQFKATGMFSDGVTQDLTADVTWASASRTIMTISNAGGSNGLATPVAVGSTSITAQFASTNSSAIALNVKAGVWKKAASVADARSAHTATTLDNGKVLIAGGYGSNGQLSSAELYDSASDTWSSTGNMSQVRELHSATLLKNGKVLVAGGGTGSGISFTSELYDPITRTWTLTGNLDSGRFSHTSTLLPDGRVLVTGGSNLSGTLSSAEIYDPETGRWSLISNLSIARTGHTATLLVNGKVLVAGGESSNTPPTQGPEVYDPITNRWTALSVGLSVARSARTASFLPNGKILFTGGLGSSGDSIGVDVYDPITDSWAKLADMPTSKDMYTVTVLQSGIVLVTGGNKFSLSANPNSNYLSSTQLYDPMTNTWTTTGSMNTSKTQHTATLLSTGNVLVVGGHDYVRQLNGVELF